MEVQWSRNKPQYARAVARLLVLGGLPSTPFPHFPPFPLIQLLGLGAHCELPRPVANAF